MKPTDVLKEEHRLVLEMLKVIGAVCAKLDKGEAVDAGHLASIIDFIRTGTVVMEREMQGRRKLS